MAGAGTTKRPVPRVSAREAAMNMLTRIEQDRAYSNLLLHQTLQKLKLERQEAALATELVYGTVQRLSTIDYFLNRFVAKGLDSLQPWVRSLLRLSFYQLFYLDRIPSHAVVNEAVNLAKRKGHAGISGMVNGVLRNIVRHQEELTIPDSLPVQEQIALAHAHPLWLVERWIRQFGQETTARICEANNEPPHMSVRVNRLRGSREALLAQLKEHGFDAVASSAAPDGIVVSGSGSMAATDWFKQGFLSIQDESSMLVAESADLQPGMNVLDCCAAPGGKTTHMAEKMRDTGRVTACDIHAHKANLIREQVERLGLTSVHTVTEDAAQLRGRFPDESFDCVLLDAPCSGLGVIRRKPDLKWNKTEREIGDIAELQQRLLNAVWPLVKPGGVLIYSTCTLAEEENEGNVNAFLQRHPEFSLEAFPAALQQVVPQGSRGMVTILPSDFGSDGFFIARLRRKGSGTTGAPAGS